MRPAAAPSAAEVRPRCMDAQVSSGAGGSGSRGGSSKRGTAAGSFCEGISCTITRMRRKPSRW